VVQDGDKLQEHRHGGCRRRAFVRNIIAGWSAVLVLCSSAGAEVRVHNTFGDNMVLQRGKPVSIWGWARTRESVTVTFGGQKKNATADREGRWSVALDALEASGEPRILTIKGPSNTVRYENVLVGDVWLCGGQSNMEHELDSIYHANVEKASAHYPNIRLMTVPFAESREPLEDVTPVNEYSGWNRNFKKKGYWIVCSPKTVGRFCGIGYLFGRRLHMVGRIPIGIVDASVGGTTIETWTSPATMKGIPESVGLYAQWEQKLTLGRERFNPERDLEQRIRNWQGESEVRKRLNMPPVPKPSGLRTEPKIDHNEPSVRYNAMIAPLKGMALKGVIFNQGWNNAGRDCRPTLYAKSFKGMIGDWRKIFGEDDLPFGVIAFTSGGTPQTLDNFELMMLHAAPWIREGQFAAYKDLKNVGYTAAYDTQMTWYHPFNKRPLAERMARWALATQYGISLGWRPAVLVSHERKDNTIVLTFDREVVQLWENKRPIEGMAIAGEDRHFYPAKAHYAVKGKDRHNRDILDQRKVVVWNELVPDPVAIRYAWAQNPLGNLSNRAHHERMIPMPCFRTDDWPIPFGPESDAPEREAFNRLRNRAKELMKKRKRLEAELLYRQTRE
jgi:sialate O-acetylesterase